MAAAFPNFKVVATTLRTVHTRDRQRLGRDRLVDRAPASYEATHRASLEIFDRVGGGDSFASGLVYGLLEPAATSQTAVEYGAAHGALAMTTPGDTSMASLAEVRSLVEGRRRACSDDRTGAAQGFELTRLALGCAPIGGLFEAVGDGTGTRNGGRGLGGRGAHRSTPRRSTATACPSAGSVSLSPGGRATSS